jgi:hypothetical protein
MNEVPADFDRREELNKRFDSVKSSYLYAAPEAVYIWWNKAAFTLSDVLGKPDTPWKEKIATIFADEV